MQQEEIEARRKSEHSLRTELEAAWVEIEKYKSERAETRKLQRQAKWNQPNHQCQTTQTDSSGSSSDSRESHAAETESIETQTKCTCKCTCSIPSITLQHYSRKSKETQPESSDEESDGVADMLREVLESENADLQRELKKKDAEIKGLTALKVPGGDFGAYEWFERELNMMRDNFTMQLDSRNKEIKEMRQITQ